MGLSALRLTWSAYKDCDWLILLLAFILVLVNAMKAAASPGKKCPFKSSNLFSSVSKSLYKTLQILVILELSSGVQGF